MDMTKLTKFNKDKLVLRQQLIGAGFFDALVAMEFADKFHSGLRKDGVTPEFQHQVSIALYALTLPLLRFPEEVIATIMLHDVREDFSVSHGDILALFGDAVKAERIAQAVDRMTKTFRGVKRSETELFALMADDPIASIAKGCDRIHNLQSMIGVFSLPKQTQYIGEARDLFLPMLKTARRNFPYQVRAYENIKFVLTSQMELIEASLAAQSSEG